MESGHQQRLNTTEAATSPDALFAAHYGHIAINRRIKEQILGVKQVCSLSKPDVGEPEWTAGGDSDSDGDEDEDDAEEAGVSVNVSENDEDNDTGAEPPKITVGAADIATWHQQWDSTGKLRVSGDIIEMPWHSLINRLFPDTFPLTNANQEWEDTDYYVPITLLLNAISLAYARRTQQTKLLGVFMSPNDTFHGDIHNSLRKPDVVLFWTNSDALSHYLDQLIAWDASKKSQVNIPSPSFNQVVSPGEVKTKDRQKSYLNMIKIYRPDLAEIFGFSAGAEGFQLWKLNPCECLCTREYKWELYSHFVEYFEVLYSQTPSKMLVPVPVSSAAQLYEFKPKETSYSVFPFIATPALGRMTWVGLGYSISAHLCIIKLSWIDVKAWDEFDIYEAVHEEGWLPGVARHIEAGIALENPTRITWSEVKDVIKRRQRYIVLGSVGDPLNMCQSVLDFLMVMHDVLETLEMLHKTGVMHRDLSWTNILCNPQHHHQTKKPELQGEGIGKKLGLSDKSWRSLLVDFDHGLLMEKKDQGRDQRIGTPMFIATDLASSLPVHRKLDRCLLEPALECIPRSRYQEALLDLHDRVRDLAAKEGEAFLAKLNAQKNQRRAQRLGTPMFIATDLASSFPVHRELNVRLLLPALKCIPNSPYKDSLKDLGHRVWDLATREADAFEARLEARLEANPEGRPLIKKFKVADHYTPPPHSLLHEAESIFWIISFGLVRALPEGFEHEPGSGRRQGLYDGFCRKMLSHRIGDALEGMGRDWYKTCGLDWWAALLHPSLKNLAPMLHAMGNYLAFAWDKIPDHDLGECHAYQVMKALLVVFIKNLLKSGPIKLNTSYPRPANLEDDFTSSQVMPINSNKRRAERQEDPGPAKKQKTDDAAAAAEQDAVAGQVYADEPEEPSYHETVDFEGKDPEPLLRVHKDAQRRQSNELRKRRWFMMRVG